MSPCPPWIVLPLALGMLLLPACIDERRQGDKSEEAGDGTTRLRDDEVRQPGTELVWLRCAAGQTWDGSTCAGTKKETIQDLAESACPPGYRLPTVNEIKSLLDECRGLDGPEAFCSRCRESSVCRGLFPTDDGRYWSSTRAKATRDRCSGYAVSLGAGAVSEIFRTDLRQVRCVRAEVGAPVATTSAAGGSSLEAFFEVDPVPRAAADGTFYRNAWLMPLEGCRGGSCAYEVATGAPLTRYYGLAGKKVVARGSLRRIEREDPFGPCRVNSGSVDGTFHLREIELAPGEIPAGSPPSILQPPPLVTTMDELEARRCRWARLRGTVIEYYNYHYSTHGRGNIKLRLSDGAWVGVGNVPDEAWSFLSWGREVTVIAFVQGGRQGDNRLGQVWDGATWPLSICDGDVPRCGMDAAAPAIAPGPRGEERAYSIALPPEWRDVRLPPEDPRRRLAVSARTGGELEIAPIDVPVGPVSWSDGGDLPHDIVHRYLEKTAAVDGYQSVSEEWVPFDRAGGVTAFDHWYRATIDGTTRTVGARILFFDSSDLRSGEQVAVLSVRVSGDDDIEGARRIVSSFSAKRPDPNRLVFSRGVRPDVARRFIIDVPDSWLCESTDAGGSFLQCWSGWDRRRAYLSVRSGERETTAESARWREERLRKDGYRRLEERAVPADEDGKGGARELWYGRRGGETVGVRYVQESKDRVTMLEIHIPAGGKPREETRPIFDSFSSTPLSEGRERR